MACANVVMNIQVDQEPPRAGRREVPPPPSLTQFYQATMMVKDQGQSRMAMKQQSAVYGSMQMATGLFSIALGTLTAVTKEITYSYMTLFRLSHLTGVLFLFVGLVSNMLFKYPALVGMVFAANLGSIAVAIIAVCLISVDLANWSNDDDHYMRMELLELLVLCFEVFLSATLCFCFSKQQRAKSP